MFFDNFYAGETASEFERSVEIVVTFPTGYAFRSLFNASDGFVSLTAILRAAASLGEAVVRLRPR
jgi:hypothetical protein